MKRTNRRPGKPATFGFYSVRITDWDWSYNFGIAADRNAKGHLDDCRHLHVHGVLLHPGRIKARKANLIFIPEIDTIDALPNKQNLRNGVGCLHLEKSCLIGHLEMPKDALDPVLQMLEAGSLKYVALDGEAIRNSRCVIRHYEIKRRGEKSVARGGGGAGALVGR